MQRDSLVYVPAAAAYAIVFAASDDGVCEVGLIDPGADDYSLSVPTASVEPMEPAGPENVADLAAQLAVLHLRVSRGIDVARSFEAFVGRAESGSLELWFSRGSSRATPRQTASAPRPRCRRPSSARKVSSRPARRTDRASAPL